MVIMKILFCGMTDSRHECSIDFSIVVLQLPFAFNFERMHLVFSQSYKDIFQEFLASEFDCLVCCPTNRASMEFMRRALTDASKRVIVGMEPIPRVDWDRVAKGQSATVFNAKPSDLKLHTQTSDGYCQMKKVYDFESTFPSTFVYKKGERANKSVWLDIATPFSSTAKVEFAGCIKYRFLSPEKPVLHEPSSTP